MDSSTVGAYVSTLGFGLTVIGAALEALDLFVGPERYHTLTEGLASVLEEVRELGQRLWRRLRGRKTRTVVLGGGVSTGSATMSGTARVSPPRETPVTVGMLEERLSEVVRDLEARALANVEQLRDELSKRLDVQWERIDDELGLLSKGFPLWGNRVYTRSTGVALIFIGTALQAAVFFS